MNPAQEKVEFIRQRVPEFMRLNPHSNKDIDLVKSLLSENNFYKKTYPSNIHFQITDEAIKRYILLAQGVKVITRRVDPRGRIA